MAKFGFLLLALCVVVVLSFFSAILFSSPPSPATPPTLQIGEPTPPSGCYYLQVQCVRAPCDPILVCPSPTIHNPQPTTTISPTCTPRPKCLDATPRCLLPETPDMCPPSTEPITSSTDCKTGSCSGELCTDAAAGDMVSICIYDDEYSCLKYSQCERQASGQCGWTQTSEYLNCLLPLPL